MRCAGDGGWLNSWSLAGHGFWVASSAQEGYTTDGPKTCMESPDSPPGTQSVW
jgi:hypothetical protein